MQKNKLDLDALTVDSHDLGGAQPPSDPEPQPTTTTIPITIPLLSLMLCLGENDGVDN